MGIVDGKQCSVLGQCSAAHSATFRIDATESTFRFSATTLASTIS